MDPETSKNVSKNFALMRLFSITISVVNVIISGVLLFAAWVTQNEFTGYTPYIWMVMILNIIFCVTNIKLLNAIWARKVDRIKYCLEVFILLFILNIVPMTSQKYILKYKVTVSTSTVDNNFTCGLMEETPAYYETMWNICKVYSVFIVIEIYFVYRYYDYELKFSLQNVSPPISRTPCASIEQNQMASSHNIIQQSGECITQQPVHSIFLPAGQNKIHQAGQNATQQPLQYIIQQPVQYTSQSPEQRLVQLPVASVYTPSHLEEIPSQSDLSMTTMPGQDLNLKSEQSITQKSVKLTCNLPPYSKSED